MRNPTWAELLTENRQLNDSIDTVRLEWYRKGQTDAVNRIADMFRGQYTDSCPQRNIEKEILTEFTEVFNNE